MRNPKIFTKRTMDGNDQIENMRYMLTVQSRELQAMEILSTIYGKCN